jgi:hypothetical protein
MGLTATHSGADFERKRNILEAYKREDLATFNLGSKSSIAREAIDLLVWFYDQQAGAENLIKETYGGN